MPVTFESLKTLGKELDIVVLSAESMTGPAGMYRRMRTLEIRSGVQWVTLRGPVWVGDQLMMFMVRPRDDEALYNDMQFDGECTNGHNLEHVEEYNPAQLSVSISRYDRFEDPTLKTLANNCAKHALDLIRSHQRELETPAILDRQWILDVVGPETQRLLGQALSGTQYGLIRDECGFALDDKTLDVPMRVCLRSNMIQCGRAVGKSWSLSDELRVMAEEQQYQADMQRKLQNELEHVGTALPHKSFTEEQQRMLDECGAEDDKKIIRDLLVNASRIVGTPEQIHNAFNPNIREVFISTDEPETYDADPVTVVCQPANGADHSEGAEQPA